MGALIGPLTDKAARELGLTTQCMVAAGLIDAHAGALGTIGACDDDALSSTLALVAGSSNCHMALAPTPRKVPGVWGPYRDAVLPGFWLNEGGQSATGLLLDHLIDTCSSEAAAVRPHDQLTRDVLLRIANGEHLPASLHVLPDVFGNRSPLANPQIKGTIFGLTIEDPKEQMLKLYWAGAASIAYGTRHIIDEMNKQGHGINRLALSGGHTASPLLVALYGDATGCEVMVSSSPEPVLLGTAMAAAACIIGDLRSASRAMAGEVSVRAVDHEQKRLHDERYGQFLQLLHFSSGWYSGLDT